MGQKVRIKTKKSEEEKKKKKNKSLGYQVIINL